MTSLQYYARTISETDVSRRIPEVQVGTRWSEPVGTLGELTARARIRAEGLVSRRAELEHAAATAPETPSFADGLRGSQVAVIAEIKRRSPSRGEINGALRAGDQAEAYMRGGAAAVSVLTEPERFGGAPQDLSEARGRVELPLLRKDFIVHPLQLAEARSLGASAVLLIARALDPGLLAELADAARALGVEPFIEVRDDTELDRALRAGARVIGVNNRDLETLRVNPETVPAIVPHIPQDVVAVAESGIRGRADVERASDAGADAVLVGSSVSAAPDPAEAVRALVGVAKRARVPRA
jgi:indole-3-glycerol phosphate synthase